MFHFIINQKNLFYKCYDTHFHQLGNCSFYICHFCGKQKYPRSKQSLDASEEWAHELIYAIICTKYVPRKKKS